MSTSDQKPRIQSARMLTGWHKSNISLKNYQCYLTNKPDRFQLSLIDLLYISNFKGGNATINVAEHKLNIKLQSYSVLLRQIHTEFNQQSLQTLNTEQTQRLIDLTMLVVSLSNPNKDTNIDGFKSSYLSALLHSYFPTLIPILDRRLLINLELVTEKNLLSTKQVRKIESFYPDLIFRIKELVTGSSKTLRELDMKYFSIDLPAWAK